MPNPLTSEERAQTHALKAKLASCEEALAASQRELEQLQARLDAVTELAKMLEARSVEFEGLGAPVAAAAYMRCAHHLRVALAAPVQAEGETK